MLDRVAHDEINLRQHFSADPVRRGIGRRPGRGVDHGAEPVRNGAFQNRLQIGDQFLRRITLGRCRLNRNRVRLVGRHIGRGLEGRHAEGGRFSAGCAGAAGFWGSRISSSKPPSPEKTGTPGGKLVLGAGL